MEQTIGEILPEFLEKLSRESYESFISLCDKYGKDPRRIAEGEGAPLQLVLDSFVAHHIVILGE